MAQPDEAVDVANRRNDDVTERMKLPGLAYILLERGIKRSKIVDLGIEPRRVSAICNTNTRAEPWETRAIIKLLDVTLQQLITVPENAPPLPERRKRGSRAAHQPSKPSSIYIQPLPSPASTETVLSLSLIDGTVFNVSTTQPITGAALERMSKAMVVLVTEKSEKS